MDFIFDQATANDAEQIDSIFKQGKTFLKAQGIDQWQGIHSPSIQMAKEDIQKGIGYVLRESGGDAVAYAAIIPGTDPTYIQIDGHWISSRPYCAIHRVAVSDSFRGKGLAKILLAQCKIQAKTLGAYSVRIDTHAENQIMQRVILHSDFIYCGIITLAYGAKRNAYECIL